MEERVGVGERPALQLEKTFLIPASDVLGAGVHVDGEVEQVADREAVAGSGRLEHVESLDDEDVGLAHDDLGVRHNVVAQVRVER